MLRLVVICMLIINSIFWGFFPVTDFSPHQKFINKFGFNDNITKYLHIFLGIFFYLFALVIAHNIIF